MEFMTDRLLKSNLTYTLGALIISIALPGCAGMALPSRADCNVVRLQTQAGRSESEIASALGVTAAEVQGCASMASAKGATSGGGGSSDTSAYISAGQAAGAVTSDPASKPQSEEEKPPWAY